MFVHRRLAQLLRSKIPDTYAVVESIRTEEYGDLPTHKEKGEGGTSNLEKRIAVNFYNKFLRFVTYCYDTALQSISYSFLFLV